MHTKLLASGVLELTPISSQEPISSISSQSLLQLYHIHGLQLAIVGIFKQRNWQMLQIRTGLGGGVEVVFVSVLRADCFNIYQYGLAPWSANCGSQDTCGSLAP